MLNITIIKGSMLLSQKVTSVKSIVIYRLKTFRTYVIFQARQLLLTMLRVSSSCWTLVIRSSRSTILLKSGSKAPLKKLRSLSLSVRRGPRGLWSWPRGLDWLKVASGCLRMFIRTSCEQQQLDRGWLLAVRRFWRRGRLTEGGIRVSEDVDWN